MYPYLLLYLFRNSFLVFVGSTTNFCISSSTRVNSALVISCIVFCISCIVFFLLKEENGRIKGSVHSTKYRPYPIAAGGLEIPLLLNFKSTRFITHQKMKGFMTSLYSYEYEPHVTTKTDDEENEINFMIENEEHSEVVKPKKRKKPPMILETSSESSEESDNGTENRKKEENKIVNLEKPLRMIVE